MLESLRHLDWGSVPAWFGGISFLLAFRIFLRDRALSERGQVNQLGVWSDEGRGSPHSAVCGRAVLTVKNASNLPIRVSRIRYQSFPIWARDLPEHSGPVANVQAIERGEVARPDTLGLGVIPPESEQVHEVLPHFEYLCPDVNVWALPADRHMRIEVIEILAVDNANRRWIIRPKKGGLARRCRWYSLPMQRIRDPLHPWGQVTRIALLGTCRLRVGALSSPASSVRSGGASERSKCNSVHVEPRRRRRLVLDEPAEHVLRRSADGGTCHGEGDCASSVKPEIMGSTEFSVVIT